MGEIFGKCLLNQNLSSNFLFGCNLVMNGGINEKLLSYIVIIV